jgi:hypothetical protein
MVLYVKILYNIIADLFDLIPLDKSFLQLDSIGSGGYFFFLVSGGFFICVSIFVIKKLPVFANR